MSDDSTQLAGGGREAVGCRSVSGREAFTGNDERGCVGTKVEKKLGENVNGEKTVVGKTVVCKAEYAEENGQNGKAHKLNRLATDDVNGGN